MSLPSAKLRNPCDKTKSKALKYISKPLKYISKPLKYISKPLKKFYAEGRGILWPAVREFCALDMVFSQA